MSAFRARQTLVEDDEAAMAPYTVSNRNSSYNPEITLAPMRASDSSDRILITHPTFTHKAELIASETGSQNPIK
jgi:hypothetical protein